MSQEEVVEDEGGFAEEQQDGCPTSCGQPVKPCPKRKKRKVSYLWRPPPPSPRPSYSPCPHIFFKNLKAERQKELTRDEHLGLLSTPSTHPWQKSTLPRPQLIRYRKREVTARNVQLAVPKLQRVQALFEEQRDCGILEISRLERLEKMLQDEFLLSPVQAKKIVKSVKRRKRKKKLEVCDPCPFMDERVPSTEFSRENFVKGMITELANHVSDVTEIKQGPTAKRLGEIVTAIMERLEGVADEETQQPPDPAQHFADGKLSQLLVTCAGRMAEWIENVIYEADKAVIENFEAADAENRPPPCDHDILPCGHLPMLPCGHQVIVPCSFHTTACYPPPPREPKPPPPCPPCDPCCQTPPPPPPCKEWVPCYENAPKCGKRKSHKGGKRKHKKKKRRSKDEDEEDEEKCRCSCECEPSPRKKGKKGKKGKGKGKGKKGKKGEGAGDDEETLIGLGKDREEGDGDAGETEGEETEGEGEEGEVEGGGGDEEGGGGEGEETEEPAPGSKSPSPKTSPGKTPPKTPTSGSKPASPSKSPAKSPPPKSPSPGKSPPKSADKTPGEKSPAKSAEKSPAKSAEKSPAKSPPKSAEKSPAKTPQKSSGGGTPGKSSGSKPASKPTSGSATPGKSPKSPKSPKSGGDGAEGEGGEGGEGGEEAPEGAPEEKFEDAEDREIEDLGEALVEEAIEGALEEETEEESATFNSILEQLSFMVDDIPDKDPDKRRVKLTKTLEDKFTELLAAEGTDTAEMDEATKQMVMKVATKIANWMEDVIEEAESRLSGLADGDMALAIMPPVQRMPSPVTSESVRDWASWIVEAMAVADDWADWISKTVRAAEEKAAKKKGLVVQEDGGVAKLTRVEYTAWKEDVKSGAIDYRMKKKYIAETAYDWKQKTHDRPLTHRPKTGEPTTSAAAEDEAPPAEEEAPPPEEEAPPPEEEAPPEE